MMPPEVSVLLVEDDPEDADLTLDLLSEVEGWTACLTWARSFEEGLEHVRNGPFEVCLVDYRLGGRTGIDFLRHPAVRQSQVPCVLLTGRAGREADLEAMEAGAVDFLAKDGLTADALERSVRYAVERQRRQRSEARFRALIENSRDLITLLGPDGRIEYVSPSLQRILGFTREEMAGADALAEVHPDDRADVERAFGELVGGADVRTLRYRVRHRDGGWRALDTVAQNSLDDPDIRGIVVNSWDITDLRETQEQLRATNEALGERVKELRTLQAATRLLHRRDLPVETRVEALVDMMPLGWQYVDVAEACVQLRGRDARTLGFRETPWSQRAEVVSGGDVVGHMVIVYTEERPQRDEGPFLKEERDLLDALALQLGEAVEVDRLERQFVQAQKMEAVGRLAGGVAHDFNNVLTAIGGHAELALAETLPSDPRRQDLAQILESTRHAAALTRQLLTFSRRQVVEARVLDLAAAARALEPMLRRLIPETVGMAIETPARAVPVRMSEVHLNQVLLNLAVNASDAMPSGGRLRIRVGEETVGAARPVATGTVDPGAWAVLDVEDTGVGIPDDARASIFEPFFTTKESGTGLGLSMVYGAVRHGGGQIEVESVPGEGAAFRIFLPRSDAEMSEDGGPAVRAVPEPHRGARRILVVEDDARLRDLVRRILVRAGYTVLTAQDGEEGLATARIEAPDLVVSDMVMPRVDGGELTRRLRAEGFEAPILLMTGYTEKEVSGTLEEAGIRWIEKPFGPAELLERVASLVG